MRSTVHLSAPASVRSSWWPAHCGGREGEGERGEGGEGEGRERGREKGRKAERKEGRRKGEKEGGGRRGRRERSEGIHVSCIGSR